MTKKIGAVCVAYYPDKTEFVKAVIASVNQVDHLVVVNNGVEPLAFLTDKFESALAERISIIENHENLGVATGLNIVLNFLLRQEYTHFLLLDQDSIIPIGMVGRLLTTLEELRADDIKVAAVGPAFYNPNLGKILPFVQFNTFGQMNLYASEALPEKQVNRPIASLFGLGAVYIKKPIVAVHHLITSGCLVSREALCDIGLMEDKLFIDMVDTEWCFRALAKGYCLYGDSRVVMTHALGDKPVIFLKRKFLGHSPLRHYYMARNLFHLLRRSYIPLGWRFGLFKGMTIAMSFYSLVPDDRYLHFKKVVIGVYHGLLGKSGRIDKLI